MGNYEFVLTSDEKNYLAIVSTQTTGKYKGTGMVYFVYAAADKNGSRPLDSVLCLENAKQYLSPSGSFCKDVMGFEYEVNYNWGTSWGVERYSPTISLNSAAAHRQGLMV